MPTKMTSIHSIHSVLVDLPPSCVAFCPSQPQLFVVGTYFLHPREQQEDGAGDPSARLTETQPTPADGAQQRSGSLILYQIDGDKV
jgi:diphthine methyl ester acylhydrolase